MGKRLSKPSSAMKRARQKAFTVVELLIVVIVVGIIAAIALTSYSGVQQQAENAKRLNDLYDVRDLLELYAFDHNNKFPATTDQPASNWRTIDVRTDDNCFNGTSQPDWVPGIPKLPQSTPNTKSPGVNGYVGCYLYASDGNEYVLSAWNMLSKPTTDKPFYRRIGFRPFQTSSSTQFYTCNENVVGGKINNNYNADNDYYKHSLTLTNITSCDETPPPGA